MTRYRQAVRNWRRVICRNNFKSIHQGAAQDTLERNFQGLRLFLPLV